ncbi:hypothetical protein CLF_100565, partial [Clonorchis sinensis]
GYVTEEKTPAIFFRFISRHTFHGALFDPNGPGFFPYIPGVLHSLLVFVMNQIVFHSIAKVLTEYENHQYCAQRWEFHLIPATGPRKLSLSGTIKNQIGVTILNVEGRLSRWAEHFEQQFWWPPAATQLDPTTEAELCTLNLEHLKAFVVYNCICSLNCHRAPSPDDLSLAFFKDVGEVLSQRLSDLVAWI